VWGGVENYYSEVTHQRKGRRWIGGRLFRVNAEAKGGTSLTCLQHLLWGENEVDCSGTQDVFGWESEREGKEVGEEKKMPKFFR